MARGFPLAGLLRLRHLEQDSASGAVAAANAKIQANEERRARVRAELGGYPLAPEDSSAMAAIAAARASTRSMLAELDAVHELDLATLDTATTALTMARAKAVGLEKLEEKHAAAQRAEDLRVEQSALDELAAAAWHRSRGDDTP